MNFGIIVRDDGRGEMSWDEPVDITTNLWLSLNIRKGKIPNTPDFGLDLSDIDRVTDDNVDLIQERLEQATQWLVDIGRAKQIEISTEIDINNINRVNYSIEAIQADDKTVTLNNFVYVGGETI